MMHINTHEAYKQLVDAGVKEKAAETIIKVINEARSSDISTLATKEDMYNIDLRIAAVDLQIANVRTEIKEEIAELKGKFNTMQWMTGFLLAMCSAILLKLFLGH